MPAFHESAIFPTDISHGSRGGPQFSTEVIRLSSGHEKRNVNWTYPLERWQIAYGVRTKSQLLTLLSFFMARKGRAHGFRFYNHDDYQATDVELGSGDGSTDQFQLIKTYTDSSYSLDRKITKPIAGTVSVYLDSVLQSSPADYSIDTTTGIVDFTTAPSSGEVVTATFQFHVPMRFDTDYLPVDLTSYEARAADVPLVELRI